MLIFSTSRNIYKCNSALHFMMKGKIQKTCPMMVLNKQNGGSHATEHIQNIPNMSAKASSLSLHKAYNEELKKTTSCRKKAELTVTFNTYSSVQGYDNCYHK